MSYAKHNEGKNSSISAHNVATGSLDCQTATVSGTMNLPKLTDLELDSSSATAPICGVATIAIGAKTVTVATTAVRATDLIFLTIKTSATAANDNLVVASNNIIAGTSFVIQSDVITDTSAVLVDWMIVHRS